MGKRILLVEGNDDLHVMMNLFEVRRIPDAFRVKLPDPDEKDNRKGGVEKLLDSLPRWLRSADLEQLGVVVDADDDPAARWQSLRDRLVRAGVDNVPQTCSEGGTIVELLLPPEPRKLIRFGAWIMPNNRSKGMLEDFVAGLIHDDDMLPIVDSFLSSIPEEKRRFKEVHRTKARIHTWLAVGERPGRPMGQAIKADSRLNANHRTVEPFLAWIRRVLIE